MENSRYALILIWSKKCVLTDIVTHAAVGAQRDNPARLAINAPTIATFQIKDTKLYGIVVTLSNEDDNSF